MTITILTLAEVRIRGLMVVKILVIEPEPLLRQRSDYDQNVDMDTWTG